MLAAGAAVVVLGVVKLAPDDHPSSGGSPRAQMGRSEPQNRRAAPTPAPTPETPARRHTAPSRRDVRKVRAIGRSILTSYLAYSYAQAPARRIPRLSGSLRRTLIAHPPRVPLAERRRHVRIVTLQTEVEGRFATVDALVWDGARRYGVTMGLRHGTHGWRAVKLG